MPVSGLIITLAEDPAERNRTIDSLRRHPQIEVGEQQGHRIPVTVDTPSSEADRDVWAWLHALPAVRFVDVVTVHFTDEQPESQRGPDSRLRDVGRVAHNASDVRDESSSNTNTGHQP